MPPSWSLLLTVWSETWTAIACWRSFCSSSCSSLHKGADTGCALTHELRTLSSELDQGTIHICLFTRAAHNRSPSTSDMFTRIENTLCGLGRWQRLGRRLLCGDDCFCADLDITCTCRMPTEECKLSNIWKRARKLQHFRLAWCFAELWRWALQMLCPSVHWLNQD